MSVLYPISDAKLLIERFLDQSLPTDEWTHEGHLLVGLYLLSKYDIHHAYTDIQKALEAYLQAHPNLPQGSFHATMTWFWLERIQNTFSKNGNIAFDQDNVDDLIFDENLADRNLWKQYYSTACMMSDTAKRNILAPDLIITE